MLPPTEFGSLLAWFGSGRGFGLTGMLRFFLAGCGGGTGFGLGRFGFAWGWGFSSLWPMGGLGGWSGFLSLSPRFGEFSFPKYFSIVFFLSNWVSVWVWVFICSWVFFFAKGIGFEAIADWVWFGYELD